MQFGQFLRDAREANGFGLREFAGMIGIAPSNLSAMETGARKPLQDVEKLKQIADRLGYVEGDRDWYRFFDLASQGRVASDVTEIIESRQEIMPALLRAASRLTDEQLQALVAELHSQRMVRTHDCG